MDQNICRVCLKESETVYEVFKNSVMVDNNLIDIQELVNLTLKIEVLEDDDLPTVICDDCLTTCAQFYVFQKTAENNQSFINQTQDYSENSEKNEEELSEMEKDILRNLLDSLKKFALKNNILKLEIQESSEKKFTVIQSKSFKCQCGDKFLLEDKYNEHIDICAWNGQVEFVEIEEINERNPVEMDEEELYTTEYLVDESVNMSEESYVNEISKIEKPTESMELDASKEPNEGFVFNCTGCSKPFYSQTGLKQHLKLYCPERNTKGEIDQEQKLLFTCKNCNAVSPTTFSYFRHLSKCRGKNGNKDLLPKVLCCPSKNCSETFDDLRMIRQHMKTCDPSSVLSKTFSRGKYNVNHATGNHPSSRFCDFCNKRFDDIKMMENHMLLHAAFKFLLTTNQLEFAFCEFCCTMFNDNEDVVLNEHFCTASADLKCGCCEFTTSELDLLKQHMFFKHWTKFQCPVETCKVDLKSAKFFYFHIQMRHPGFLQIQAQFKCQYCQRQFDSYPTLASHRKNDCLEKNFKCHHCTRVFGSQVLLNAHIFKVNNPFICVVCKKSCSDSSQLKIHMRSHTKDRPYQCNICNATFLTASQRSVHIDKHETKNYKCEICSKVFQTRVHLQSHYKNHTGSINCPICGNLYASQKSLECHLRIHKKAEKEKELVEF